MLKYPFAYLRWLRPRGRALVHGLILGAALAATAACEEPDSAGPTPVPEQSLLFDTDADTDSGSSSDSDTDAGK